ncbi:hypothetical protein CLV76_101359 [Marivita geojedonensis]|nr:hypothetical protein CLV76_101359 [Marivita geojedonensis]
MAQAGMSSSRAYGESPHMCGCARIGDIGLRGKPQDRRPAHRQAAGRAISAQTGSCTATFPSRTTSIHSGSSGHNRIVIFGWAPAPAPTNERTERSASPNVATRCGAILRSSMELMRPVGRKSSKASTGTSGHPGGGRPYRPAPVSERGSGVRRRWAKGTNETATRHTSTKKYGSIETCRERDCAHTKREG